MDLTVWTGATAMRLQDIILLFPLGCLAFHFFLLLVLVRLEYFVFAAILRSSPLSSPEEGSDLGMSMPYAVMAAIIFSFGQ